MNTNNTIGKLSIKFLKRMIAVETKNDDFFYIDKQSNTLCSFIRKELFYKYTIIFSNNETFYLHHTCLEDADVIIEMINQDPTIFWRYE